LLTILKEQFAALSGAKKPVKSDVSPDHTEESTASVAPVKKKIARKSKTAQENKTKLVETEVKPSESSTETSKSLTDTNTTNNESVSLDDIAILFK
jgi:hypothetical protein